MKEPTDCILWNEPEKITSETFDGFDVVEKYVDTSHWERSLLKCRGCGQLYFHEFYEEVDWEDGEDPQYWTYIPVESDEEIALLKKTTYLELLQCFPRLQKDFPKSAEKPNIFWAKRSPSSMDDPIHGSVEQGKERIYQRYFERILDKIDVQNFTNQTLGKTHDSHRRESDYKIVEEIVNTAADNHGLLPVVLQVMLEQFFWADVYMREFDKSKWIYRVMDREDDDFFPDSMTVYKRIFE